MGAPGRIRTCDPLLRRHLQGVAGRRLGPPDVPSSWIYGRWPRLGVARHLWLVAPRVAPSISLPPLMFKRSNLSATDDHRHAVDATGMPAYRFESVSPRNPSRPHAY